MYEERLAKTISGGLVTRIDENPTVEENIDRKISYLQSELDRLQKSKEELGPLLKMRIRDIRQAMDY